jgi:hypothetical protein
LLKKPPFSCLISLTAFGGAACLLLSVRKAGAFAPRIGEWAAWVGGEDGALPAELWLETLPTELMELWRGTAVGLLERKLCETSEGLVTTSPEPDEVFLWVGVLRERKALGKGMW